MSLQSAPPPAARSDAVRRGTEREPSAAPVAPLPTPAPSTPEKRTFQLCLDTRIDITAPLGDDGSDTTAHSCSVVASAATSTVHHSVATSLQCRGLNRVRAHGAVGFERMVGLSVLSTNFHRIGLILQHKERERLKLQCLRRAA